MDKKFGKLVLKNIFAILGFMTPLLTDLSWKYNAVFVVVGLLISAIFYLLFELYDIDNKKYLKVKGRVPGNGIYNGLSIIKIESNPKIPKDTWLTLVTKGNSIPNSICILRVVESAEGENIQAIQILPEEKNLDIQSYFSDTNKFENLMVTVIIKESEVQTLKTINDEAI